MVAPAESLLELDYRRDARTGRERIRFTFAGQAYGRRHRRETRKHLRWLELWETMFNLPHYAELSARARYRAIAQSDWLEHPEDWPRKRWPAWKKNEECLDDAFINGAANTVRMGIAKALQKRSKISA